MTSGNKLYKKVIQPCKNWDISCDELWYEMFLRAELDYSTSDLSRLVTVLINTVIILMIAVAITLLISRHLRRLSQVSILQSHHKLLGEKVIVTKTADLKLTECFGQIAERKETVLPRNGFIPVCRHVLPTMMMVYIKSDHYILIIGT